MDIDIKIQGIPCVARLHGVTPGCKGDRFTPPEAPEFDFSVLDMVGMPAPLLKQMMSDSEYDAVCEQLQQALDAADGDAAYDAHRAKMGL